MLFVIVKGTQVFLGPVAWNAVWFRQTIKDDFGIDFIPLSTNDLGTPITVLDDIKILPVTRIDRPPLNELTETYAGPYWSIGESSAAAVYDVVDKPVEHVKGDLKNKISAIRYAKETNGFEISLNDQRIHIPTGRDQRSVFMNGIAGTWKLKTRQTIEMPYRPKPGDDITPELLMTTETLDVEGPTVWMSLTDENLSSINTQIKQHIQAAFDWEATKMAEVDAATTNEELLAIELE